MRAEEASILRRFELDFEFWWEYVIEFEVYQWVSLSAAAD